MHGVRTAILAFVAIVITAAFLWLSNRSVPPNEVTWENILAEASEGGYQIIDTQALWQHYSKNRDNLILVDTRQEWEYRTGHIKGALNFPMDPTWLARWRKAGALEAFLGTNKDRFIVFY